MSALRSTRGEGCGWDAGNTGSAFLHHPLAGVCCAGGRCSLWTSLFCLCCMLELSVVLYVAAVV